MLACDFPVPVPTSQMVGHQHSGFKRRHEGFPDSQTTFSKRPAHGLAPLVVTTPTAPPTPTAAAAAAAGMSPLLQPTAAAQPLFSISPPYTSASQVPTASDHHKRTRPAPLAPVPSLPPLKRPRHSPGPGPFCPPQSPSPFPTPSPPWGHAPTPKPAPSAPLQPPPASPALSVPSTPLQPAPPDPADIEEILPTTTTTIGTAASLGAPPAAIPEGVPGQLQLSRYLPPLAYDKIDLAPPLQKLLEEQVQARFQLLQPSHTASGAPAAGALIVYDPAGASLVTADRLQQLAQQAAHLMRPRAAPNCTIEEIDGSPLSGSPASPTPLEQHHVHSISENIGMEGMLGKAGSFAAPAGGLWGAQQGGAFVSQAPLRQQQQQQQQALGVGGLSETTEQVDMDVDER